MLSRPENQSRSRESSRNAALGLPIVVVVVLAVVVVVVVVVGFLSDGTQNRGRCDRLTWFSGPNWESSQTCLVANGAFPRDL